jgi:2-polyprenyl-3-methyl-5-hydroxy-6-metoxy-1,4-benzoquinol methylase
MKLDLADTTAHLARRNEFDGHLLLGAADFNRTTLRTGQGRPSSGFITPEQAKVVEDTGLERYRRREGMWEEVAACPVCGGAAQEFFLERMGVRCVRCPACTHIYADPVVKRAEALKVYSDDQTAFSVYTGSVQKDVDWKKYQYGLDLLETFGPPGRDSILDIGCGAGVFLQVALAAGWRRCVGVDANAAYASVYREAAGVQYINGTFEGMDPDIIGRDYDAVAMWNVLEHIYDPRPFLRSLSAVMRRGALLFVMVPNVSSLATRLTRTMSPRFNWKHLHYFSPDSLRRLTAAAGLECLHMETAISEIGHIKSYMAGEHPYQGPGDTEGLFDFITPEFIHRHMLGSRLIMVARLPGGGAGREEARG